MANIHQFYLEHMASKTGYRATWEPNRPLFIGAIVTLEKGVFTIQSSLEKEGIPMEVMDDLSEGTLDYSSTGSVQIGVKLAGQAPLAGSVLSDADAGFSIDFASEKSIVFQADKTKTIQITNMGAIEREVIKRVKAGQWVKEWAIVTQLVQATTATIIISFSSNSKIDLKASANVGTPQLKLTDASLGLTVANEKGSHFKAIASSGITPLYRVAGFRHPLFGRPQLSNRSDADELAKEKFRIQPFDPAELE
ncbi:hypothetical protein [Larkinella terrae]|uniref:Uncharacterized protein n=1 Tax=Larkinella terrae TaxID=2025311 RepID=A0A7K0EUE5_9BACT|nr:hypothetical protein [Larkinella terrae]MRS65437.1 hypothetical protein [Larkinella terrae]